MSDHHQSSFIGNGPAEIFKDMPLSPASSAGFWTRLFRRSKPYLLPLALLDCIIVYYFSRHLSLAKAADGMVVAMGSFHSRDPRVDALIADAQSLLGKSIFALLIAGGGAILCVAAVSGLCWSARCLRKRKRMAADFQACLQVDGSTSSVTILDISEGGCRISVTHPLALGASVRVTFGEALETPAKVVWHSEHQAGLQFSAPLTEHLQPTGKGGSLRNLKGCRTRSSSSMWRVN
jgi:hypothetical protein